jgi:hypothetical protein
VTCDASRRPRRAKTSSRKGSPYDHQDSPQDPDRRRGRLGPVARRLRQAKDQASADALKAASDAAAAPATEADTAADAAATGATSAEAPAAPTKTTETPPAAPAEKKAAH